MKLHALKGILVAARNYFQRLFGSISDAERTRILGPVVALGAVGCGSDGRLEGIWSRIRAELQPLILLLAAVKAAEILEDQRMREMNSRFRTSNSRFWTRS